MKRISLIALIASAITGCSSIDSASAQQAPPAQFPGKLEARRVLSARLPNFYVEAPSPDGRLMTDVDWDTGDLAVIDLESGQRRRVTDKGPWSKSNDYAGHSAFSPDGKQIAYTWFNGALGGHEVRTIGLDGSSLRVLLPRRADSDYVEVADWSRDGASILVIVARTDRTRQIGILSVKDGTYRALKTNNWRLSSTAAFSPDGRYVAYDLAAESAADCCDIFLISVDGAREVRLLSGARLHGWLPGGDGILYGSASAKPRGLYALHLKNFETVGAPELVQARDSQMFSAGFSRDAYFYGSITAVPQVYVAPVDLKRDRMLGPPQPLVADLPFASGGSPSWAPDGQRIAYMNGPRLIVRSVTGELQKEFRTDLTFETSTSTQWTPDGAAVLLFGRDGRGRQGIHQVKLADSSVSPVVIQGPNERGAQWFTVGKNGVLYYRVQPDALPDKTIIMAHDLATGQTTEIARVGIGRYISVSPNGSQLALYQGIWPDNKIVVLPVSGGAPKEIARLSSGVLRNDLTLQWTPDNESLLAYDERASGATAGVWVFPVSGGTPRLLAPSQFFSEAVEAKTPEWAPRQLRLSPDGTRIAYVAGERRGEYWMLSGFQSASR